MKVLSSLAVLVLVLYYANALNSWCCYDYIHSVAGWLRVYKTPADRAMATKVCAAEGAKLATTSTDNFKEVMLTLAKRENVTVYAEMIPVPYGTTLFDQHRVLKPDGDYMHINEDEKYPFICFREFKDFETNDCGVISLRYELDRRTDYCYKFHNEVSTWDKANETCNDEGANLAVINSYSEALVIKDLFAKYPEAKVEVPSVLKVGEYQKDFAFIGVSKVGKEWMTNDGKTLAQAGYDKFATGEPNNARGDENCLAVSREGLLIDEPCTRSIPFVCKRIKNANMCHNMSERAKCNAAPLLNAHFV